MSACPATADTVFGPRVDVACRTFDFTFYFEDAFLAFLPSAIFISLLPVALWQLRSRSRRVKRSVLLSCKLVALIALLVSQLAFVLVRQLKLSHLHNKMSIPADVLELLAITGAIALSSLHHTRSIRPSTLLVCFLSARSLLGIARVRTLWLIPNATRAAVPFTLSVTLILLSTVLESIGKESALVKASEKPATPEPFSGFWKRAAFAWLTGTFRNGYSKVISVQDLPELDPKLDSEVVGAQLQAVWARADKRAAHALLRACLTAYRSPLLTAALPRLMKTGFTFCQPFLIDAAVSWVGNPNSPMDSGRALIGAFALVYVGQAVSTSLYGYQTARYTIRLRGGLIALVHRQTVNTRAVDLGESTAITLMGTDVERIVSGSRVTHELWASLLEIAIAIYLLERQVGVACLVPAVIVLVFVAATFKVSGATNKYQRLWIERIEERLRLTSYTLENIKAVKMLGLSEKLYSIIRSLRHAEIATSTVFRKLLIVTSTLSNSPADLAPMATFVVYVIIALVRDDKSLLAAQAFTSLSLVSLVTDPVLTFILSLPEVVQCLGCFNRIQEYCCSEEPADGVKSLQNTPVDKVGVSYDLKEISKSQSSRKDLVAFSNLSVGWTKNAPPVLRDMTLTIQHGAVTMIVGPIGSGKSTFLETILGESLVLQGRADRDASPIAYCSQAPWLQSTTIRENILAGLPVDTVWYDTVLRACGLEGDLARLPRRDQTPVGSNGIALSGGQKQRIALARALYSRCRVLLLDDVFSGIDAATTEIITRSLFGDGGLFQTLQSTVVLATHSSGIAPTNSLYNACRLILLAASILQYADHLVVLTDGHINGAGTLHALQASNSYIQNLNATHNSNVSVTAKQPDDTVVSRSISTEHEDRTAGDSADMDTDHVGSTDATRQNGDMAVYAYYASVSGRMTVAMTVIMALCWSFCHEFSTIWLDWWTEANAQHPNERAGMYLGVYVFLSIISVVFMVAACWLLFVRIVSKSSLRLHDDLLKSTMRAPFQFFHNVDVGSITNRFSQDMDLIDMTLPIEGINLLSAVCSSLVKVIILAVFAKYLAIAIPFLAVVLYLTQKFYLRTSRQMRLLDIEAKAPLYTHFLELVGGATTVRAFHWHVTFNTTALSLLNISQRPVYMLSCIQQCLGLVLDLIVAAMAVIVVSTVVFLRDHFNAGDVGVALVMVMTFSSSLMELIKYWTMTETSIGAIARVKDFVAATEPEDNMDEDSSSRPELPRSWPANGAIQLSGVVASHSMSIQPGQKIAICGPSGSGKTSLILTLLRMIPLRAGTITIDDLDLTAYAASQIRPRLNIVTQDPLLLPGSAGQDTTVRFNIDPFGSAADDATIIAALERLGLWTTIAAAGGLDAEMKATAWSAGQRQLLCLARAMVRGTAGLKVLILDEATSSVDPDTEAIIQNVLDTEFQDHTVLSVLHRLRYVGWYDRVAVLEGGELVEFDKPDVLLAREESKFARLYSSLGVGGH
ncbi:P-loop containing nucleoside triphosphate hydrolase protein [Aspergillus welwitschiae]|uniref:P-loop containing nucleoside triphosphate hydrolase protein n=1 Tax=Aspergillus welwitschiae TaxID=1341132 RepID=A0A3F3QIC0_9EURO|nr:P-loop containing nucleoside triphosphate hydrolase protein [Aspergillus welwitschiae]RDH38689.1 P-loop containing nucleoside triphosphate hydrolase protein [Aspergillus welwitschiae]